MARVPDIFRRALRLDRVLNTIFSQIASEALGIDFDLIEIVQPDTGSVPNSGPTVASRTAMVVGKLVESAVIGLRQTLMGAGLLNENYTQADFQKACADYIGKFGPLRSSSKYQPPPNVHWAMRSIKATRMGFAWAGRR